MLALALLFLVVLGSDLLAQTVSAGSPALETSQLMGTVLDQETGEPLVGANVFLTEIQRGASADIDGHYIIRGIPSGTYTLQVSFAGFRTNKSEVEIGVGRTVTRNVRLRSETNWSTYATCYPEPLIQNTIYARVLISRVACLPAGALTPLLFSVW